MKKISFSIIVVYAIFVNACNITTLYPIFKEKDIVFNRQLLGYWKINKSSKDGDFTEIKRVPPSVLNELPNGLQKIAGKGYLITRIDQQQNTITRHLAFLVKIGKHHYLDYYPLETDEEKEYYDFFKFHYIKMHGIYLVEFKNGQSFELKQFDEEFIRRLIDTRQINLRHEWQPYLTPHYIITAPTEELQAFLIKYADDQQAYAVGNSSDYIKLH